MDETQAFERLIIEKQDNEELLLSLKRDRHDQEKEKVTSDNIIKLLEINTRILHVRLRIQLINSEILIESI
jgi:hypothetical protein